MGVNKVEANGEIYIDLTSDSVTPETLAKGVTAHDARGEMIVGTLDAKSDTMVGTWIFNEVLELHDFNFSLNFVLPNVADSLPFHTIYTIGDDLLCVDEHEDYHTPYKNGVWVLPDWRTITITEEPTDAECIAWLKANAIKTGYEEGYEKGYEDGEKAILSTYVDWSISSTSSLCIVDFYSDTDYYAHIYVNIYDVQNSDRMYYEEFVLAPYESYSINTEEVIGTSALSGEWRVDVSILGFSKDGEK